jgi:hypothetical protein
VGDPADPRRPKPCGGGIPVRLGHRRQWIARGADGVSSLRLPERACAPVGGHPGAARHQRGVVVLASDSPWRRSRHERLARYDAIVSARVVGQRGRVAGARGAQVAILEREPGEGAFRGIAAASPCRSSWQRLQAEFSGPGAASASPVARPDRARCSGAPSS